MRIIHRLFDKRTEIRMMNLPPRAQPTQRIHKHERDRRHDANRRQQHPWRNWYKLARWKRIAAAQLAAHPLCQRCLEQKPQRITPATVCHHVDRHEGDPDKFWFGPFASVCAHHHNATEQGIEARGYDVACDPSTGQPLDPSHPWNR
jgi:5-methylcytosine-specific restriction protein A